MSDAQVDLQPRLPMLPIEEFDDELREMVGGLDVEPGDLGPLAIQAHRPGLAKAMVHMHSVLWTDRLLSDRLHELVRLHIAFFNQCRSCMAMRYPAAVADGLTEDLVCSLERPYEAETLSDGDRAALRYAELMATDHLAVDGELYDELGRHFSEAEIVELGMSVAFCVGFGRLAASWHVVEHLPERFQREGIVTPWA